MQRLLEQMIAQEKIIMQSLTEIETVKEKIMGVYNLAEENKNEKLVMIPFAAYELQAERNLEEKKDLLERHAQEKDKMRKHYQKIIIAISAVLIALIVGIFSTVLYFMANFDFATIDFAQDITLNDGSGIIEDGIEYHCNTQ